ncbi:MAG: hypothetical protein KDI31_20045, partial [Pseudomonadales bacterium]|nr:hypothetical protein [Pseudomonadales bacterium]
MRQIQRYRGRSPVLMIVASMLVAAASVAASAASAAAAWQPARTADGVPDLQGNWTNATVTALERPAQFDSLVLTEEQALAWEGRTAEMFAAIDDVPEEGVPAGGDVGGYNSFWMDPGTRVMRVNGEIRSSILISPKNGKLPWRLGARAKLGEFLLRIQGAFDGPEQRPLGERCLVGFGSTGGPPMLPVLYNNNYQIVQSPGYVMIMVEMNHDARIIRLDSEHLPADVRPWMGDSIGHWEGNTLVVETTNFHPGQSFRAAIKHQFYVTKDAVVTEWFTPVSENEIVYRFEVNDPGAYTENWIGEVALRRTQDTIYEYACHEG